MGFYINPGYENFKEIRNDVYVDKSGLLSVLNETLGKSNRLTCVSRPRRFGKSYAANMIQAYYDCSCDSHKLFDDLEIARMPGYEEHINKYNVIYLDITGFMSDTDFAGLPAYIIQELQNDIGRSFDGLHVEKSLKNSLVNVVTQTGKKFIAIIDEWDSPIRDPYCTPENSKNYLEFLRSLFKSDITKKVFAGAYMTGILPVKKDGSQSAISEFNEYTILDPDGFAPYTGFTEEDVRRVCKNSKAAFEDMKAWYDGYTLYTSDNERISVYNPNSVMKAARNGEFKSYWEQSSAAFGALDYINMDFDGLGEAAEKLTAGLEVEISTSKFQNDLVSFESAFDVLTLLTHFGYFTYDKEKRTIHIPNYEVQAEFGEMIHRVSHKETMARLKESEKLLSDIVKKDADAVAENIRNVHMKESAPIWYNDEQALRAVVKLAFFTYRDHYMKLEELPSGKGYVDMAYIPRKYDPNPPLIIKLKAGGTPEEAMEQIRSRNYTSSIEGLGENPLLIAITYDKDDKTKPHHCMIE